MSEATVSGPDYAAPTPAAPAAGVAPIPEATRLRVPERQLFDPRQKSPRVAAVLSVVPGLGQIYIGYYSRGFVLAASILLLGLLAASAPSSVEPLPGFAIFFFWLFNVIDAGRMAALYNHAAAGTDVIEMPEDFKMPAMGGSIVGGALLVGFGLIALSNTLLGFSLDWIGYWWPVFPLALGAYLLARGVADLRS